MLEDLQAGHQRFLSDTSRHPHCSRERFLEVEDSQASDRSSARLCGFAGAGGTALRYRLRRPVRGAERRHHEHRSGHRVPGVCRGPPERGPEAAFHPELRHTPNLAQVVGLLRMELFALGAAENLAQACRDHCRNAARNLVDSSVLLRDRVRAGTLRVEAAFYNLHTTSIDWLGPVSPQPLGRWAG